MQESEQQVGIPPIFTKFSATYRIEKRNNKPTLIRNWCTQVNGVISPWNCQDQEIMIVDGDRAKSLLDRNAIINSSIFIKE